MTQNTSSQKFTTENKNKLLPPSKTIQTNIQELTAKVTVSLVCFSFEKDFLDTLRKNLESQSHMSHESQSIRDTRSRPAAISMVFFQSATLQETQIPHRPMYRSILKNNMVFSDTYQILLMIFYISLYLINYVVKIFLLTNHRINFGRTKSFDILLSKKINYLRSMVPSFLLLCRRRGELG